MASILSDFFKVEGKKKKTQLSIQKKLFCYNSVQ